MRERILAADPPEFWFSVALLVAVAAFAFYGLFRWFTRARLIEDTPTSKIRSAAQGYVELTGLGDLLPGPPVVAPLSQLQCLWYRYSIDERSERGHSFGTRRDRRRWQKVESGSSDDLFRLADETGECVVDPEGAEVTPEIHQVWYGNEHYPGGAPPVARGGGLSDRLGIGMSFGMGRYRYTEQRILPASRLYVIGQYRTLSGAAGGDRDAEVGSLLRAWKQDKGELLKRFDADGDGTIDLVEWEAARRAAEAAVDASLRERQRADPVNVIAHPATSRRPFIISVESQRELATRLKFLSAASLLAFLACGALAVWALGVRLGA